MAVNNGWGGFKLMDPENSFTIMDISREGSVSGSSYSGMSSLSAGSSGSTSTMSTTGTDEQGNEILALERRSVKPFKSQDEYLYAMKEDLAEWLNNLYQVNINVDNFFEEIETGVIICEHANAVQEVIKNSFLEDNPKSYNPRATPVNMADYYVTYRKNAKPGTFLSRDNISNFLTWCVRLGIPDNLRFESDDLVLRKHERNVILCLLEVARRGAKYGMLAPTIVQMEEEIDAEIAGKEPPPPKQYITPKPQVPHGPQPQKQTCDLMSLDEMVRKMVSQCTCPSQFPMVKVSDGKYKIGDSQTLIFVRILRNHVMVRIGGGWDTLEHYLDRHDPCRCHGSHTKGHNPGKPSRGCSPVQQVQMSRRSNTPTSAPHLAGLEIKSSIASKENAIAESPSEVGFRSKPSTADLTKQANKALRQPKKKPVSSPRRTSLATSSPSKSVNRSFSPHSSPRKPKRTLPNVPAEVTAQPSNNTIHYSSSHNNSSPSNVTRPRSALERRHSEVNQHKQLWKWDSDEDLKNSRQIVKNKTVPAGMELNSTKNNTYDRGRFGFGVTAPRTRPTADDEVLVISRDDSGGHKIGLVNNNNNDESQSLSNSMNGGHSNNGTNGLQRTFSANKFQISADKLLPSKPNKFIRTSSQSSEQSLDTNPEAGQKRMIRSQYSGDSDSYSESSVTNGGSSNGSSSSPNTKNGAFNSVSSMTRTWSQSSAQSIDASDFDTKTNENFLNNGDKMASPSKMNEYPEEVPPEDLELNRQMELLFQEYRKIERATLERHGNSVDMSDLLNSTQPLPERKTREKIKSSKQDFSQVKSKLKEYLMNSPKKASNTPRNREQQPHYIQPHRKRSVTPNPTSSSAHKMPVTPRRNLPRPPSPAGSTSSSISSHSAFTPVSSTLKPNIKAATASASTTAWRQTAKKSTADLNSTTSDCDSSTLPRGRALNSSRSASSSPSKRPSSARPSTPRATMPVQKPIIKEAKAKPPVYRPASAPLHRRVSRSNSRRGSRDDLLEDSINDSCGGFAIQSSGAWAQEQSQPSPKSLVLSQASKSMSQSPMKTPTTAKRATPQTKSSSANKTVNSKAYSLAAALRCKSTTCLASTSEDFVQKDRPQVYTQDDLLSKEKQLIMQELIENPIKPSSRRDDRCGPKTRIPQPSRRCQSADPYSTQLKRCDSGVDINNMSPADSNNEGEDAKIPWVDSEGVALSPQALAQYSPFEDTPEFF